MAAVAISKAAFVSTMKPIEATINGMKCTLTPRHFAGADKNDATKTGSVGYNYNGKMQLILPDGSPVTMQVGLNVTACKSKEWAEK